jgi:diadenosine tetraphosphate (Ap4A) HIT family hydrolase
LLRLELPQAEFILLFVDVSILIKIANFACRDLAEHEKMFPKQSQDRDITAELISGRMPGLFRRNLGRSSRILSKTDSLVLLPTVSPLLVGHVLIFSKQNVMSFADLLASDPSVASEYLSLVGEYETRFGRAIEFEHGSSGCQSGGCGVARAHVHLIPRADINERTLSDAIAMTLGEPSFRQGSWMLNAELQHREYLSLGRPYDDSKIWIGTSVPSQLVRKLISQQLALPQWDWNELFGWEILNQTIKTWYGTRHMFHAVQRQHSLLYA